jgi:hypothetical protein
MSHLFWLLIDWVLIPIQIIVQTWIDNHDIDSEG